MVEAEYYLYMVRVNYGLNFGKRKKESRFELATSRVMDGLTAHTCIRVCSGPDQQVEISDRLG